MYDMDRRLNKIEKHLSIREEPRVEYIIFNSTFLEGTTPYPCDLDSIREWETFKAEEEKAKQIAKECGLGIMTFEVDPFREYEVRNALPEGILSKHKNAGKIPFYLLAKATKIDQKQPNDDRPRGIEFKW